MPPAAKHRDSLIAASADLFQRQGYAATGLAEILSASGAPRGSLYHYFPDGKEEIAEAALRDIGAAIERRIRAGAAQTPDPRAFAIGYGKYMAKTLSESGFTRGCPVATVALEATPHSARLTPVIRDILDGWCAAVADMLTAAGINPTRAAELGDYMVFTFEGALTLARVRQSTAPLIATAAEIARLFDRELQTNRSES
jgi:TetR/AcrR family transcriptional repressor of lmrAB and yxaGH operons